MPHFDSICVEVGFNDALEMNLKMFNVLKTMRIIVCCYPTIVMLAGKSEDAFVLLWFEFTTLKHAI